MITKEENELLTRTGPGTPMGNVIRRYWVPAVLSSELPEPDCPPVRVMLLGERLVAFRDSSGRIGLLDEFCAHRRASLFLGRNEEHGLRCLFHGWKYDAEGNCVDMPNEPPETNFKDKIHLKAYPTVEMGGVVWAYLGPKNKMPLPPKFEWTQVLDSHRHVSKTWEECNWLQALEGGLDTVHVSFLHRALSADTTKPATSGYWLWSTAPKLEVELTDYGYLYASIRSKGAEGSYVRTYHYVMPFHQLRPHQFSAGGRGPRRPIIPGHVWVPMDDKNCMVYNWVYSFGEEPLNEDDRLERSTGNGPGYVDPKANFRKLRNKDNDWLIDRKVQKTETFSGIEGINTQDHAIQESMGPIVDRTQEHLASTDRAIFAARRLLLQAVKTVQEGKDPPGLGPSYYRIRAIEEILPNGDLWGEALKDKIYPT
jgi:phenylpropionate dioxygenase-like ring-hydroxylating dioxygenase large terminal subunit